MQIYVVLTEKRLVDIEQTATVGNLRRFAAEQFDISDIRGVCLYFNKAPLSSDAELLSQAGIGPGATIFMLSREAAKEHGQNCYVRSVRGAFDALKSSGGSEATALREVQPFPLESSIYELGQLGPGWVLFFEFLWFAGALCLVLLLVQIPAMWHWATMNNISKWPAATERNEPMVTWFYLSAGNSGPEGSDSTIPAWCMLFSSIILLAAAIHYSRRQHTVKASVDAREVDPNDFALFIEGLPEDAKDQAEIAEFIRRDGREKGTTEVVTVVIGYDVEKYQSLRKEFAAVDEQHRVTQEEITILQQQSSAAQQQQKLQEALEAKERLAQKRSEISSNLASPEALTGYLPATGSAVVVLRSQKDHRECVHEWNTFSETLTRAIPSLEVCLSSKPLFRGRCRLRITRAANPTNIMWENLTFSKEDRMKARVKTYAALVGLFLVVFFVVGGMSMIENKLKWKGSGAINSLVLMSANIAAAFSIRKLVMREKHATKTERDLAIFAKLSLFYAMTYSLIPYLVDLNSGYDWYRKGGLLTDQWALLCMNAIMYPLITCIGIPNHLRGLLSRRVDPANAPPGMNQVAYQKMFEPPDMDVARAFAKGMKTLLVGLWFAPMVPWSLLITCGALAGEFWAYKYQLLRLSKMPYRQGHEVAYGAIRLLLFASSVFAVRSRQLLYPSLTGAGSEWLQYLWTWLAFIPLVMIFFPARLNQFLFATCICQKRIRDTSMNQDYYAAQEAWPKHQKYQNTNIVYQQIETIMVKQVEFKKRRGLPWTLPWEPKTGNFPDPLKSSPPAAESTLAGSAATTLGVAAVLPLPHPALPTVAASDTTSDEDEPSIEMEGVGEPLEETAAVGEADPLAMALEEEKFKGLGYVMPDMDDDGGDSTDDDSSSGESGSDDYSDVDVEPGRSSPPRFEKGTRAMVSGLVSVQGAKFNGSMCTVLLKADGGKWLVRFENGNRANIPDQNLSLPISPGDKAKISGLTKGAQYNGTVCDVISYDTEKTTWLVRLFTGVEARMPAVRLTPMLDG